jgi:hypothetical protein
MWIMGQLFPSYRASSHRRVENEQVTQELYHDRCELLHLEFYVFMLFRASYGIGNPTKVYCPPTTACIPYAIVERQDRLFRVVDDG